MKAKSSAACQSSAGVLASMFEAEEAFDDPNNEEIEDTLIGDLREKVSREELWRRLESGRESRHWMPWRSREEEAEDPERSVAYDDICGFLFQFPSAKYDHLFFFGAEQ